MFLYMLVFMNWGYVIGRPRAGQLLSHSYFSVKPETIVSSIPHYKPMKLNSELRCADLTLEQIHEYADEEIADGGFTYLC